MNRLFLCLCFSAGSLAGHAQVQLAKVFGDSMVLQRDRKIPVWGWAGKNEKITVQFHQQTKKATAGSDGKWQLQLDAEPAGGPYELVVNGKETVTLHGILMGDVWICSGQSNMEFRVSSSRDKQQEIASANYPAIRHFKVSKDVSVHPKKDLAHAGSWQTATPANVGNFTAAGYFFARDLYETLKVPIGLLHTSWGGTEVETWISNEGLSDHASFTKMIEGLPALDTDSLISIRQQRALKAATQGPAKPPLTAATVSPNGYPSLLYNAMVAPLVPFAIKGVIWYQGESNASRAFQYREAFPLLIKDWRNHWKQGDFPFYFVQLASFKAQNGNSAKGSGWAELREAQTQTLAVRNTGMAVTIDIGETNDIHPKNKQDVGKRLAAVALHDTYGKQQVYTGPVYQSMKADGDKVTIRFTQTGGGLSVKDAAAAIKGFEIAGDDQQFHPAQATIVNGQVVVSASDVPKPVAVRYAWADDAGEANLYNKEGFPAGPFRTDDWKAFTADKKYKVSL